MLINLIKIAVIAILAYYVIGVVAPLIALPAGIWVLIKLLVIVWAAYAILKLF